MANNDFKMLLGFIIDQTSLSDIEKQLVKKRISIKTDLDLESFAKSKQELTKQTEWLQRELQKVLGNLKISISDKELTSWTKQYYNQLSSEAKKASAELESFQKKNMNAIDFEIKKKEEASKRNSAMLKEQMQSAQKLQEQADKIRDDIYAGEYDRPIKTARAELQKLGISADDINAKLNGIHAAVATLNVNGDNQALIDDAKKVKLEFTKLKNEIVQAKSEYDKLNAPVDRSKQLAMIVKLNKYLRDNTNITAEAKEQIQQWVNTLNGASVADGTLEDIKTDFLQIDANMESLNRKGKSFSDRMKEQFSRISQFFSISAIISKGISSLRRMKDEVFDIDSAMTNLYKVTDETDAKYQSFFINSAKNAKDLGSKISSLITHASQWAKLGFNLNESETLAKNSMIYANVGEVDDTHAVSDLVTVMKSFNIEASDSITIVDKLNELGNRYATDAASLGEGLSNAASALKFAGNDLDQTLAMLTGGTEIIQDASEMGNALKVLSMRVRGMKGNLQELGEEYENIESISKIQTQILNQTKGQVNIFDKNGDFRSTYDILKDISEVWNSISQVDQAELLETIAGKQRGNQVAALIQAFQSGQVENAYESSVNSAGSAYKEHEKWLESLDAKTKQFEASFQSLSQTVLDTDFLKGSVDTGTAFVSVLDKIIDKTGMLPLVLGTAGATLFNKLDLARIGSDGKFNTSLNPNIKIDDNVIKFFTVISDQDFANINNTGLEKLCHNLGVADQNLLSYLNTTERSKVSLQDYNSYLQSNSTQLATNTLKTKALAVATNALINIGVAFTVGMVTSYITSLIQKKKEQIEATKEAISTSKEEVNNITDLLASYNSLDHAVKNNEGSKEDLLSTQEKLLQSLGIEEEQIDGLIQKYGDLSTAINEVAIEKLKGNQYNLDQDVALKKEALEKLGKNNSSTRIIFKGDEGIDLRNSIKSLNLDQLGFNLNTSGTGTNRTSFLSFNGDTDNAEDIAKAYEALTKLRDALKQDYAEQGSEALADFNSSSFISDLNLKIEELSKAKDDFNSAISEANKNLVNIEVIETLKGSDLPKTAEEFEVLKADIANAVEESNAFIGSTDDISKTVVNCLAKMPEFAEWFEKLTDRQSKATTGISKSEMIANINQLSSGFESLDKIMASIKGKNPFDYSLLDSKDFKDTFGEMGESYTNFIEQISNSPNDINACQSAFNDLVTTWLDSTGILDKVTDETAGLTAAMLSNMGVMNAEDVVTAALAQNHAELAAQKYYDANASAVLEGATADEINQILGEADAAGISRAELAKLELAKRLLGENKIDLSSDIDQIIALANAAVASESVIRRLNYAKQVQNSGALDPTNHEMYDPYAVRDYHSLMNGLQSGKFDFEYLDPNQFKTSVYGGGSQSNKSGGSGSKKKEKEEAQEEIDWIEQTLKQLKNDRDELESKASSSFLAYLGLTPEELQKARSIIASTDTIMSKDLRELRDIAQNAGMSMADLINLVQDGVGTDSKRNYLTQLIEADKQALQTYDKAIDAYRSKYEEKVAPLSPEIRAKIESNSTDSMEIATYSEKEGKQIQAAIAAHDKLNEVIQRKKDLETEVSDNAKKYYENNIEYLDQQLQRTGSVNSLINAQVDYMKESGQIVNAYSYEQIIANNKKMISFYEQKIAEAKKRLDELMAQEGFSMESSPEYYELKEAMDGAEESIISTRTEVEKLNNELLNLPIDNMDVILSMYDSIIDSIQRWGSEAEAAGRKVDKEYYQTLIKNGMKIIDQYKEQYDLVQDVMDEYEVGSENWNTLYSKLQSINAEMSTMVENLHKWNEALLQMPLDSVSKYSGELQKALDAMSGIQSEYDTVITAVTDALQKEIDLLNEARDLENEKTQAEIDVLQERLDLLNQQNEALKLQSAYEQALYENQRANTQETERVIRNGEFVFEKNADNIRNAQENLQDALANLNKYNLEQEIEVLQDQLDAVNDRYEEQIDSLEKISEKWSEISKKIIETQKATTVTGILGEGWKDKVLSGNDDDIYSNFSGMYQTLSNQMTQYQKQIESTENIYALLEDYIAAYKEGTITYDQAVVGINDLLSQMNQKMSAMDNLENVLDYLSSTTGADASVDSVLSSIQDSLVKTGEELIASFEQYNENAALISEYTTSWQQLTANVSDIKSILEEVRDNLEDAVDRVIHIKNDLDDDDDDDRSSGSSSGTITSGKHYSEYGPGTGVHQYASGIENGLVGTDSESKREELLRVLTTEPIDDINNAVPIIAHKGEAVLNEEQQDQALKNFLAALEANPIESYLQTTRFIPDVAIPNYSMISTETNNYTENVTYNIGDININKCDTPDQLAQAIMRGSLKSAALQRLGKRN